MLSESGARPGFKDERGVMLVMFGLLLPLILLIGVISVDIGNWWVHKRHLQTQVDAGALAAGPQFVGCFSDPVAANAAIASRALAYTGDTLRLGKFGPSSPASTTNLQIQEPNDVRAVLNSSQYWKSGDLTDGSTLDDTLDTDGDGAGDPCNERALDVKATDDEAPLLWGLIPFTASPKTHARIEIRDIDSQHGILPWAVPETDPRAVVALFVNENGGANPVVFDYQTLIANDNPSLPWSEWSTAGGQEEVFLDSGHENTGVIILVSKEDPTPTTTGPLATICNPPPPAEGLVACYGGSTQTSGISFIHAYNGGYNGSLASPQARQVELFASCSAADLSAAYFTLDGNCSAAVQAVIDFGVTGDPTVAPTCALVDDMTWSAGGLDADLGTWTGSIFLPAGSGRNTLNIRTHTGPKKKQRPSDPDECPNGNNRPNDPVLNKVAAPYVANSASGPVQYLKLTATHFDGITPVGDANSVEMNDPNNQSYNYVVTVGLPKPLSIANYMDPPVVLRSGNPSGSQNQAWDCDRPYQYREEIANGCQTTYRENFTDLDGDGDKEWRNFFCTGYSNQDLAPPTFNPVPPPDCIRPETGDMEGQQRQGLHDRLETPCTSNNWPDTPAEADIFFGPDGGGYGSDPRYVTLLVADDTAFQDSEGSSVYFPIKYFAGFYVTGWDLQQNQTEGCPDIDGPSGPYKGNDCHPIYGCNSGNEDADNGDVWGYFVDIVVFSSDGVPSDDLCTFGADPGACIAVLVE